MGYCNREELLWSLVLIKKGEEEFVLRVKDGDGTGDLYVKVKKDSSFSSLTAVVFCPSLFIIDIMTLDTLRHFAFYSQK